MDVERLLDFNDTSLPSESGSWGPLLFTLNCLNGYSHFSFLNLLTAQFGKAEGRKRSGPSPRAGFPSTSPRTCTKRGLNEIVSSYHARHVLGDPALRVDRQEAAKQP
jgi:hypothetical protein